MKLTPEQVAAFEARAKAGEKPVLEWRMGAYSILSVSSGPPLQLRVSLQPVLRRHSHSYWILEINESGRTDIVFPVAQSIVGREAELNAVGIQLAVEHLLREATRGLHQKAYRAIEEVRSFAWGEKQMCSISQVGPYENILELLPPKEQTDEAN